MNFHFSYLHPMRNIRYVLAGMALLTSASQSLAQTAPASPPAVTSQPVVVPAVPVEETPDRLLLKVGLNAGRSFRWGGYNRLLSQVPLTVASEYSLNSKFTVYGQVDTDFGVRRRESFSGDRSNLIPSGAVGIGGRYYYNQAGRALQNRAHGPFIGNYLGLELHTEMRRLYGREVEFSPGLNFVWGMQRRLNRNFLFDLNAGVGVGPNRNHSTLAYVPDPLLTITTQLNLGIYFGR